MPVRTTSSGEDQRLAAETRARAQIDQQLRQAGWEVQGRRNPNLFAGQGIALREVAMAAGRGRADYLLYVDQRVVGVIEAKPAGTPLSGVEWQSAMYAQGLLADVRLAALTKDGRLPFVFEASGTETHFTSGFDPEPRARRIFNFPKPSTLARTLRATEDEHPTWRGKVQAMPALERGSRPAICCSSTRPACSTRTPPVRCSRSPTRPAPASRSSATGTSLPGVGRGGVRDLAAHRVGPQAHLDLGSAIRDLGVANRDTWTVTALDEMAHGPRLPRGLWRASAVC